MRTTSSIAAATLTCANRRKFRGSFEQIEAALQFPHLALGEGRVNSSQTRSPEISQNSLPAYAHSRYRYAR
jgi:hypothetical protein